MTCDRKAISIFVTNPIIACLAAHLFELFLECPGSPEVIAACGLGCGGLRGSGALTLGEGGEGKPGEELGSLGPGLSPESLQSGEAVKTGLETLGAGQTLLGQRLHGQQVRPDPDGAELARVLGLHVALVVRGVLGPDVVVVGVVPQVGAAVPGGLGLVLRHSAPRRLKLK